MMQELLLKLLLSAGIWSKAFEASSGKLGGVSTE